MNAKRWAVAGLIARLAIGGVLLVAGTAKLSSPPEEFAVVIESYDIVSSDAAHALAAFMPWGELILGFAMIFGFLTPMASAACGVMFAAFEGAIGYTLARGIPLPNCGCFGSRFHPKPPVTMAMDLVLLAAAAVALRHGSELFSLDNWAEGRYTPARKP